MPSGKISGKANIIGNVDIPTKIVSYTGETTETSTTLVDNDTKTISVNVDTRTVTQDCAKDINITTNENNVTVALKNGNTILSSDSFEIPNPDLSNYVTTNTEQLISSAKTFSGGVYIGESTSSLNTGVKLYQQYGVDLNIDVNGSNWKISSDRFTCTKIPFGRQRPSLGYNKEPFNNLFLTGKIYSSNSASSYGIVIPETTSWTIDKTLATIEDAEHLVTITWSTLKDLRDNSQLIPGRFYRIIDYNCTTTASNTSSAGHVFDIIVLALTNNKLSEEAWATLHSGDTYFANSKLEAWKLWYCLDNDINRFAWSKTSGGKGVIYRMIDEFGNDCPYDFKNILFAKSGVYENAYTFSYTESSVIKDASLLASKQCYNNAIKEYIPSYDNKLQLSFNVFYSTSTSFNCYNNTFGSTCYLNTFGNNCYANTFGSICYNNTFGNYCSSNTFGNSCYNNTFKNNCTNNTFGNYCSSNTFGNSCDYNIFGNECDHNTFGNYCEHNTFENECDYNTFGAMCYNNTFRNNCDYNTFGDSSSAINYCRYNIIDSGCSYLYMNSSDTAASDLNQLQYIHIHLGVKGSSASNRKTITIPDRNLSYETNIVPAGTTTIEV